MEKYQRHATVRFGVKDHNWLKKLARKQTRETSRFVGVSDLIRQAVSLMRKAAK